MKVNLGCGQTYKEGWVNVDASPDVRADIYMDAFEFVATHGAEVDELYMGHFLEHLLPASAAALLAEIGRKLPVGAEVSAVVPDMSAIFAAYGRGEITNETLNAKFIYSYVQPSPHVWCYDAAALVDVFRAAGFADVREIDPHTWPPVYWKAGEESEWQCGVAATVIGGSAPGPTLEPIESTTGDDVVASLPVTLEETLLARITQLRTEADALRAELAAPGLAPAPAPAPEPAGATVPAIAEPPPPAPLDLGAPHPISMFDRLPGPVRPAARRLLADGSPQRRLARFSIDSARVGRSYAEVLRHEWARARMKPPRTPSYEQWCSGHDAGRALLQEQSVLSKQATNPLGVVVVVWHRDPSRDLDRTLRSVLDQSWQHTKAIVVRGPGASTSVGSDHRVRAVESTDDDLAATTNAALADVDPRDCSSSSSRVTSSPPTARSRLPWWPPATPWSTSSPSTTICSTAAAAVMTLASGRRGRPTRCSARTTSGGRSPSATVGSRSRPACPVATVTPRPGCCCSTATSPTIECGE